MASISADLYRGKEKQVEEFIKETKEFLDTNWAIMTEERIDELKEKANRLIGRMEILREGLKTEDLKWKYQDLIAKLDDCISSVKDFWSKFGKNN